MLQTIRAATKQATAAVQSWMPSANIDAQTAHVFAGAFVVLSLSLRLSPLWAWAVLFAWIGFKEYVFDLIVEQDSMSDSTLDAAFYLIGGVLGSLSAALEP